MAPLLQLQFSDNLQRLGGDSPRKFPDAERLSDLNLRRARTLIL